MSTFPGPGFGRPAGPQLGAAGLRISAAGPQVGAAGLRISAAGPQVGVGVGPAVGCSAYRRG